MPAISPLRALVFDFDGLVIDSERCDASAWQEEFARAGVPITIAEYAQFWSTWSWQRRVRMIDQLRARAARPVDEGAVLARRLARYEQLCADLPGPASPTG